MSTVEPQIPHIHREDILRMSRQYVVETLPSGRQQFVALKRSRSHHHHHDHHGHHGHHHRDCANVTVEEWENLVERERNLREVNDSLSRENSTLKTNLYNGDAELRRLQALVPHLQRENNALRSDNESLRRSLDAATDHSSGHHHEVEKLKKKVRRLEKENEGLLARIRDLTRQCQDAVSDRIVELREAAAAWRRKFDDAEDRLIRVRRENYDQAAIIAEQGERLTVYERILRRHGLLL